MKTAKTHKCGCREPKRHADCQYCGSCWAGEVVCGVCHEQGIDGKVIRGTERRRCRKHREAAEDAAEAGTIRPRHKPAGEIDWVKVVEEYMAVKPVKVEVVADPKVSGVFAIMATFHGETSYYGSEWKASFLLNTNDMDTGPDWGRYADYLEEVEFTSWPPVSGQPKFFV